MTLLTISGRLRAAVQRRRRLAGPYRIQRVGFLVVAFGISASLAAADPAKRAFNIEARPATQSLTDYARQAHTQLGYDVDAVEDILTNAVAGEYDSAEALELLLENTGLAAEYGERGIFIRRVAKRQVDGDVEKRTPPVAQTNSLRFAQTLAAEVQAAVKQNQMSGRAETEGGEDEKKRPLEEIIVTGTRIKGVKDRFSPVMQVSREEMDLAGFNNVSDVVESLPQNFGGGAAIDTSQADTPDGPGGSGVNLRGLGNQATLILLNGRRLAAGGSTGNFVDVSSIPASAIDRVEVLTDGASAIYGADAIAGVVNIILRDDFDGAETRLNVGTITDGGGDYWKLGQTLGWSGDHAHGMVTFEYSAEEELDSNDKDFAADATEPTWLLPFTQKHSVLASTGAQLSDAIKLSADGYFNDRNSKQFTSIDIPVAFIQAFQVTEVQQYGGALGLDAELGKDWEANLSGSYSRSEFSSDNARLNSVGGDDWNAVTEILSVDGSVGGPIFNISSDPAKAIIGAHYRSENADLFAARIPSGDVRIDSDKSRDVYAVFGEIYAPIVSDGNNFPGIESLAITAAARYEDYSDVGSNLVPKVGLSWSFIPSLNLRGTYGRSFRAPRLDQLVDRIDFAALNRYVDPMAPGGESIALLVAGTKADLDPESSRTWTAGFDFAPDFLDGLLLRGTYFNTIFENQVGQPSFSDDSSFRYSDFTGIPIRDVSQDIVQELCAQAALALGCFNFAVFFPALAPLALEDVEILLDARFQNLSLSKVAGFDFEGSYDLQSAIGEWRFYLGGTLLTIFEKQVAPAVPIDDLLNTYANPVDLKLRSGVQWRTESIATAVFVNHVGDYVDDEVPGGDVPIDSFTTLDATIRLNLGQLGSSPRIEGTFLSFSVINMLNEHPPFIRGTPNRFAVFDAANANPAERKIGLLLTKRW